MGKEYIEREAAKKAFYNGHTVQSLCERGANTLGEAFSIILDEVPAADVRPVVRGRWIRHYEQADTGEDIITYPCGWVCSECGRWESEDEPFCNCGAMMEES